MLEEESDDDESLGEKILFKKIQSQIKVFNIHSDEKIFSTEKVSQ